MLRGPPIPSDGSPTREWGKSPSVGSTAIEQSDVLADEAFHGFAGNDQASILGVRDATDNNSRQLPVPHDRSPGEPGSGGGRRHEKLVVSLRAEAAGVRFVQCPARGACVA